MTRKTDEDLCQLCIPRQAGMISKGRRVYRIEKFFASGELFLLCGLLARKSHKDRKSVSVESAILDDRELIVSPKGCYNPSAT